MNYSGRMAYKRYIKNILFKERTRAILAYINFNGNCREAVRFYAEAFGVPQQKIMAFGDMPPDPGFPLSEESKNLVMHTYLEIADSKVMFSDVPPGMPLPWETTSPSPSS
jgi:uncharacterized glyoxalase superfamily protein PhnB